MDYRVRDSVARSLILLRSPCLCVLGVLAVPPIIIGPIS